MFVHGMDERTPDIESLAEETPVPTEDEGLSYKFLKNYLCIRLVWYASILLDKLYNLKFL